MPKGLHGMGEGGSWVAAIACGKELQSDRENQGKEDTQTPSVACYGVVPPPPPDPPPLPFTLAFATPALPDARQPISSLIMVRL